MSEKLENKVSYNFQKLLSSNDLDNKILLKNHDSFFPKAYNRSFSLLDISNNDRIEIDNKPFNFLRFESLKFNDNKSFNKTIKKIEKNEDNVKGIETTLFRSDNLKSSKKESNENIKVGISSFIHFNDEYYNNNLNFQQDLI